MMKKTYNVKTLLNDLETVRTNAQTEYKRLCNNNQYIDACVFQIIRDRIDQDIQLLQPYVRGRK